MSFRAYQETLKDSIREAWQIPNVKDVLAVMFTGGGKTKTFVDLIAEEPGHSIAIAHRQELVVQMSLALAREGVYHAVVAPDNVQRVCMAAHLDLFGKHFVASSSRVMVAGVDTLIRAKNDARFVQVRLVVIDEGHHCTQGSKWAKARAMFPNARGLLVTATPLRADGKGLGRHADGIVDRMVLGPGGRWLIDNDFLTEYRIFVPPSDLDLSGVSIAPSGDFSPDALRKAVHKSHITGDVVEHYLQLAAGKLGITFAVDIAAAVEICAAYRAAGVPAEVITGDTEAGLRTRMMRQFRSGDIKQLVSVDVLGEGVDVPAVEVVSFARPTQSYGLYVQQFGRVLRKMDGKHRAIVIDHVSNVKRHGLPDAYREWSLDRRERRSKSTPSDEVPIRVCAQCASAYERALPGCPYCGVSPVPARRDGPEFVDGKLGELDEATLARMRGAVAEVDSAWVAVPQGAGHVIAQGIRNRHAARQTAQMALRRTVELWGGWAMLEHHCQLPEAQSRFYSRFHIDTLSAAALPTAEAIALEQRVRASLPHGIIAASVN